MSVIVTDCPRCGCSQITFDVTAAHITDVQFNWQNFYEAFCICRHCKRATIFALSERVNSNIDYIHQAGVLSIKESLNNFVDIEGYVSLKDQNVVAPPDHVPQKIEAVFNEGATCLVVDCFNAAGTMFRLCIDLATRSMLPKEDINGLNSKVRRDLGLRLPWLLANKILPDTLKELSSCIKEDGNDGAHAGTLTQTDAEDMLDFTTALLERIYTEPERLRLAQERREDRRTKSKKDSHQN